MRASEGIVERAKPHASTPEDTSGLATLRARIHAAGIAPARADNLRLATWNVRELGKGTRLDASIRMIAAILDAFDLVSIVELRDDLGDMRRILHVLGPRWGIVFSDYLRDAGGNRERVAFVFRRDRVTFTGLGSTAESPRTRVGEGYARAVRWWRPPFMASFAAGAFDFILVAAHVRWGGASGRAHRGARGDGGWDRGAGEGAVLWRQGCPRDGGLHYRGAH